MKYGFKMAGAFALVAIMLCMIMAGCEKVDKESQAMMGLAAHTSKERAATIRAMKPEISAIDEADAPHIAKYLDAHAEGLEAESKALADFTKAAGKGSLHKHSVEQLIEMASTAKARSDGWSQICKKIQAPKLEHQAFINFCATHQEGLNRTAAVLDDLSKVLKKKLE